MVLICGLGSRMYAVGDGDWGDGEGWQGACPPRLVLSDLSRAYIDNNITSLRYGYL